MRGRVLQLFFLSLLFVCGSWDAAAQTVPAEDGTHDIEKNQLAPLPANTILVPGAVPASSDRMTPVPEANRIVEGTYHNDYFGLTFKLPDGWTQKYSGPPPSDNGAYVLAELVPNEKYAGTARGTIIVTAQDLFFSLRAVGDALSIVKDASEHLESFYTVERAPAAVTIANHPFARFDYTSAAAQLHWVVLATEIRCHALQFVFTSRDTALLESLVHDLDSMKLSDAAAPACVPNYAVAANLTYSAQPVLEDRRFNAIPVRIVVGTNGRVKHVHVISAFADQSRIVTDAVSQWRFKPSEREVETGILFGTQRTRGARTTASASPD